MSRSWCVAYDPSGLRPPPHFVGRNGLFQMTPRCLKLAIAAAS